MTINQKKKKVKVEVVEQRRSNLLNSGINAQAEVHHESTCKGGTRLT